MMIEVRFYGPLADLIGEAITFDMTATAPTVGDLRGVLAARHPAAAPLLADTRTRCFIGDAGAREGDVVTAESTVEFLPPVSGG